MGMDVFGLAPTTESGRYFRASVWTWASIHALIAVANAEAGLGYTAERLDRWRYNYEEGLATQAECDLLADAIAALLTDGHRTVVAPDAAPGASLGNDIMQAMNGARTTAPLELRVDRAEAFVEFLRGCGGFRIE